ncbi:hypothetical protein sscle_02g015260 [Sclerotinia sclerotiorum 1980 UF-70]|uniref:Zn(2)-C6 fungal-type domain-containing protein n=1 Tax=Sclerotinia sclerotiorum (strain ATCC 18683 / 1980 / Ss-1) TaxID=665079 RepID=A0A1D9PVT2_SCLS1|nr:hypothetical protein sscle_02g015260 [Sclerotinia sclerotiorum 1980 UF-70]
MNPDSVSSPSSGTAPTRKDRGPIASQACDVCRQRKQRCDEKRPKCGLCTRLKIECNYREPVPTKKDKTMVEILDRVKSIEDKIDRLPHRVAGGTSESKLFQITPTNQSSYSDSFNFDSEGHAFAPTFLRPYELSPGRLKIETKCHHFTASHKILTWPAVQQLLLQAVPSNIGDLKDLERGSVFIVRMQAARTPLSLNVDLQEKPFVGMQSLASRAVGGSRITFPTISRETIHQLTTSYFDTFNFLYPFMDRQNFVSDTLTKVTSEGFDGDVESVLALLIFALGDVALENYRGNPVDIYRGRPSGIRGGSGSSRPPGLAFFNEAMKRIGCVLTDCSLENVQIFCLTALYYQTCCRHMEFWRSMVSASSACNILITSNSIDWKSPKGDLIKRAYWHCATMETTLHLDMDLPLSSMMNLEKKVELPLFLTPFCEEDFKGDQQTHWQAHNSSVLALRRICVQIQNGIHEMANMDTSSPSTDAFSFLSASGVQQLASQLTQWRGLLPSAIQWDEDDPASFPSVQTLDQQTRNIDPNLTSPASQDPRSALFSTNIDEEPTRYPYAYDIQVAVLRTRFYYAKYMVYRPFVYKVLHFPELVTPEDAQNVAECLRSCLLWPILLSPPSRSKRLIPYLFTWSQIFLSILLIVHLSKHNAMLKDICENMCGERYHEEIDNTVFHTQFVTGLLSNKTPRTWVQVGRLGRRDEK